MELNKRPYLPLFVQDVISDEKLRYCSMEAHGCYFLLMCHLHKQEEYGVMHLLAKFKTKDTSKEERFAAMLAILLPFQEGEILGAIRELAQLGVITLTEDTLSQKRMVRDAEKSRIQAQNASRKWKKSDE